MFDLLEVSATLNAGLVVSFVVAGALVLVLLMGFSASRRPLRQEEDLAASLAGRAATAEARVTAWERRPVGCEDHRALRLTLAIDAEAMRWEIAVPVVVEKELVANFSPGRTVYVLYDPEDPSRVAIDRDRSPVAIPLTADL
ncbi:MAG TPA: hypothetical protein PKE40_01495 [Arachnia sp.]|nr:hypothetical protein [Arachnia sp.]HMT85002.1 hypothetical protein [Arachnia sp.]